MTSPISARAADAARPHDRVLCLLEDGMAHDVRDIAKKLGIRWIWPAIFDLESEGLILRSRKYLVCRARWFAITDPDGNPVSQTLGLIQGGKAARLAEPRSDDDRRRA
ncbi:hypothetical protein V5F38_12165 [Xanthobacter sp. V0B-10]|uniref:hypothetical protein n=1 Tax=Xanthobacter albus TaxID=3119929 RepID=UPI00372C57E3